MGRTRSFDTDQVLDAAAQLFGGRGYDATSVDDLVRELGLHRGSMYAAFGSKRGLFLAALDRAARIVPAETGRPAEAGPAAATSTTAERHTGIQDLLLVGMLELAPHDPEARRRLAELVPRVFGDQPAAIGVRLLARAGLADNDTITDTNTDTNEE